METHNIDGWILTIPDNFSPMALPFHKEWVEALESDTFAQGKGRLCKGTGDYKFHCCLGVLSQIQGRLTWDGADKEKCAYNNLSLENPCHSQLCNNGKLPVDCKVFSPDNKLLFSLANLNDSGMTFKQIATLIKILWKPE